MNRKAREALKRQSAKDFEKNGEAQPVYIAETAWVLAIAFQMRTGPRDRR